jgi:hypothetical protein
MERCADDNDRDGDGNVDDDGDGDGDSDGDGDDDYLTTPKASQICCETRQALASADPAVRRPQSFLSPVAVNMSSLQVRWLCVLMVMVMAVTVMVVMMIVVALVAHVT